jgi:cytochrome oxidase Cu insertion factor (SCO1/SenC/PrrC family)
MNGRRLILAALAWCALIPSCGYRTETNEDLGAVGDFGLVDQDGRTVSRSQLIGKVWVASFIFTRYATLCPQVCATLAELQEQTKADADVRLVSFSVDPDHDTPKVLKEYAARFGADPERWVFLTGKRETIYNLSSKSFLLGVMENKGAARTPGNEVTHSSKLVVVDRKGHIHEHDYFDGRRLDDEGKPVDELPRLKRRVAQLLREKP